MSDPNISKRATNRFQKGNKVASKNKGKPHKLTLLKHALGIQKTEQVIKDIERNIDEFIRHPNDRVRLDATKAFVNFYKPTKKESEIKFKGTINLIANPKIARKKEND